VEHRIEFVEEVAGVRWLNDSKGTNPDSTIKAVEAMTAPTVLIAGGYDKQVPFEALAASIQQSGQIKRVVLMGQTASKIEHALRQEGFHQITMTKSLEEAVDIAASLAQPNGNVLFSPACASFDMFTDYEQRGRVFKHLVRQLVPRRICDADAPKLS
jgi:UDP-N-acetylmuramoylalanine--D-glutamate ligase